MDLSDLGNSPTTKIPVGEEAVKKGLSPTNGPGSNPLDSIKAWLGTKDAGAGGASGGLSGFLKGGASGFGASLRKQFGLPAGGEPSNTEGKGATWANKPGVDNDWRVRLSLAPGYDKLITTPLQESDNNLIFPLTPTIMINHSASYTPIKPIHSNYPFYAYQNSAIENIQITGEFPVENEEDGKYWVAAVHYLRAVSKMAYGETEHVGAPPPVIKLNGYGDYIFKDVPVVVSNFNYELGSEIDYIYVQGVQGGRDGTWVPSKSTLSVTLIPMYSRRQIRKFSLQKFVAGNYINGRMKGML